MKVCVNLIVMVIMLCAGACSNTSPEVRKQRALDRAKHHMTAKDYARAVLEFKNAAQADPRDAEVHYQMGLAYLETKDLRSAVKSFQRATELNPKHPGAQIKLAELYSAARDRESLKDAATRMETLLSSSPDNADALSTLAYTELRLGDFQHAEEHLAKAVENAPANLKAAIALAQLRIGQKKFSEAELALKRATAQQPPLATPHIILGEFYVQLKRLEDARPQFVRALEIDKDNAVALLDLGNLQLKTGAVADAAETFKRLSLVDKQYKSTYAIFLIRTGNRDRGIEELRQLNIQDPDDRDLRRQLITAYRMAGRSADIDSMLTTALKKNPKDTDALLHRARIDLASRKYTDAQNAVNRVIGFEPNSSQAHYLLATIHGHLHNTSLQRQELTAAIRLSPGFLAPRLELAQLLIGDKAASAALTLLNETPDWQRANVDVIAQRNRALFVIGDKKEMEKGVNQGLAISRTAELLVQNALLKFDQRNFAAARLSIDEVLRTYPEETRALTLLVQIGKAESNPASGIRRIQQHVAAHPKSARLQHYLGVTLERSGALADAKAAFEAARISDPSFWLASTSLAELYIKENRLNEARSLVAPLVSDAVANVQARRLLAAIEEKSGNRLAAVQQYRSISESRPDDPMALNNLAYALAEYSNSPDEALKIAQRAKEMAPDNAAVDDTLGWVLYKKGLYKNAVQHLENSVKKQPSAQRHVHLALAYAKQGDSERGFEQLAAAMKLNPALPEITEAQRIFAGR
jgi:putative PEP-CTERM system TPR-repeat lipoprotein